MMLNPFQLQDNGGLTIENAFPRDWMSRLIDALLPVFATLAVLLVGSYASVRLPHWEIPISVASAACSRVLDYQRLLPPP